MKLSEKSRARFEAAYATTPTGKVEVGEALRWLVYAVSLILIVLLEHKE